ncbi:MAG: DMT family transporter [Acidiferrobacterales bacterium]
MRSNNIYRGAAYALAAALLFAVMGACIKFVSASLPSAMVVFFRSVAGLLSTLPWIMHRGRDFLKTGSRGLHLARGLTGLGAMYCYYFAIAHLSLALATLFNYSTPLFVPLIALLWLNEPIPRALWAALFTGFAGILLILRPGPGMLAPVALIGIASAVFTALSMVAIRRLTRTEPGLRIVFYFSLVCTIGSALPLPWLWQTPAPRLWILLAVIGTVSTAAQLLLTRAYKFAPAAEVGPFSYTTVVFAGAFGWIFWGELPDLVSLAGATLVCFAGIWTLKRANNRVRPETLITDAGEPGP